LKPRQNTAELHHVYRGGQGSTYSHEAGLILQDGTFSERISTSQHGRPVFLLRRSSSVNGCVESAERAY